MKTNTQKNKTMKITKDTQTVWRLETGSTIIGTMMNGNYAVRFPNDGRPYITEYTKAEMIEIYELTEEQFDNINRSGI